MARQYRILGTQESSYLRTSTLEVEYEQFYGLLNHSRKSSKTEVLPYRGYAEYKSVEKSEISPSH